MLTQTTSRSIVVSRSRKLRPRKEIDMNHPLLMTIDQAAEALSLSRSTVQRLINSGLLPSVKVGGSRRIPTSAVSEYVADLTEVAS